MSESNDIQALGKICLEVDENQIQVMLSNHFLKVQTILGNRLRQELKYLKNECNYMTKSNWKLEFEIKNADQELISSRKALEVIKSTNIELKKEWLLAKGRRLDMLEHFKKGDKKYEDMWLESKKIFEKIPIMGEWLQDINKIQVLKSHIAKLENDAQVLTIEIDDKKNSLQISSRNNIIKLAEFFVHDRVAKINIINEKSAEYNKLTREIEEILKQKQINNIFEISTQKVTIWNTKEKTDGSNKYKTIVCSDMKVPKLPLPDTNFDDLNIKLNQIRKFVKQNTNPMMNVGSETHKDIKFHTEKTTNESSSYFMKYPLDFVSPNKPEDHLEEKSTSKRKLIHILEDINLNQAEAYNLVFKVNVQQLQETNTISAKITENKTIDKTDEPMENEQIEEIDLTNTNSENILIPPAQFIDRSQVDEPMEDDEIKEIDLKKRKSENILIRPTQFIDENQVSQERKKAVSFDLPIQEIYKCIDNAEYYEDNLNKTIDDNYTNIKELMWTRNLQLSPQFTYTKNTMFQNMKDANKIVTSKFFKPKNNLSYDIDKLSGENQTKDIEEANPNVKDINQHKEIKYDSIEDDENIVTDVANNTTINSVCKDGKEQREDNAHGVLFNHGADGLLGSLDMTISTTGFDDGDAEFPHCIDPNLLLSPKADLAMPTTSDNTETNSHEVPSFLSEIQRTGLSFFKTMSASDLKLNSGPGSEETNFNFNFGNEKKSRGGLFSMFH